MKSILLLKAICMASLCHSQILTPAKWSNSIDPPAPAKGDTVNIIFTAAIEKDWYLYSSDFDPNLGPMVTEFLFEPNDSYRLVGEISPQSPRKKYDSLWEGEYTYFKEKGVFVQQLIILQNEYDIKGVYTYQVCSDIDGKCIPFEEEFGFSNMQRTQPKDTTTEKSSVLHSRDSNDPYSLLSFMLVAFLAGLAALFTPCVFPMIPMTVTFFTGRGDKKKKGAVRNSIIYGISIILIYTLIGALLTPFMGPETANDWATGRVPNLIFFTVFVLFALSFFGLFEITLPRGFVNKIDRMGDRGGLIGVFFMALTLVLVSFSCTGPLVGSILVESAGGQVLKPILGMVAFSSAFAVLFTVFALFPNWLSTLPKSGGWLNSVKVVLGFLELALAFKFLSIADQAYHWNILDREIYLAIWIVIFTLTGFYLLGKLRLPGDDRMTNIPVVRLLLAVATFTFVVYLIPGMFGAPLNAMAGYLPPLSTHDFDLVNMVRERGSPAGNEICEEPEYSDFLHLPHGLKGYFDLEQAKSCARQLNKPIFVDFTGHGCVNCREMEQRVWSDPAVLGRLQEDFVILALYVDDKTKLPESEWVQSSYDGKWKKTIGKINADYQITSFNNNAQPFYLILNSEGEMLAGPKTYDLSVQSFVKFLDSGKNKFKGRPELNNLF